MAAQDQQEKKDRPEHGKSHHASVQSDNDYTDPQSRQAEGKKPAHAQPGRSGGEVSQAQPNQKTDNTRPGGNRKKGSNQGALDHD